MICVFFLPTHFQMSNGMVQPLYHRGSSVADPDNNSARMPILIVAHIYCLNQIVVLLIHHPKLPTDLSLIDSHSFGKEELHYGHSSACHTGCWRQDRDSCSIPRNRGDGGGKKPHQDSETGGKLPSGELS